MPEDFPLEEVLKEAVRSENARVHTQAPARVVSYDRETQRAKVQLIVAHSYRDPDTDERVYYKPPVLVNVPVIFPAILTWPVAKGDPGWVEFAERSYDEYLATGNDSVEPSDARRFDLSDAVFSPTRFRGEADTADGAAVLAVDEIRIGDSTIATYLARADRVEARLQALESWAEAHIHTAPSGPTSPPTVTPPSTSDGDTASDRVKGD